MKKYTDKEVLIMIMDIVITAMGDEWIPQEDENFKDKLKSYGFLELFEIEYNID